MGCHFLLQGIFPTQGLNSGLLHCRQMLYRLSHQGGSQINFFFLKEALWKCERKAGQEEGTMWPKAWRWCSRGHILINKKHKA